VIDLSRPCSELRMPALTLAFEKLDLRDRVGTIDSVARVCSTWAEAAAAATRVINLQRCSNTDSLQQWLCSSGAHVNELHLYGTSPGQVITRQPCPRLERLDLFQCSVDLSTGSQLLRDLSAATALKRLNFSEVMFHGEPDLASVLMALPGLQYLRLVHASIQVQDTTQQPNSSTASALASGEQDSHARPQPLWSAQHTTHRGHLYFTNSGIEFICRLTKLQGLELHSLKGVTAEGLASLQNLHLLGLDRLVLGGHSCDITFDAVPALSQLTALTRFGLYGEREDPPRRFDPAILGCMTQLQCLELCYHNPHRGAAGAAELLSRLAQLPKLKHLTLVKVHGLDGCRPEALSSLTSSSMLQCLTWAEPASRSVSVTIVSASNFMLAILQASGCLECNFALKTKTAIDGVVFRAVLA